MLRKRALSGTISRGLSGRVAQVGVHCFAFWIALPDTSPSAADMRSALRGRPLLLLSRLLSFAFRSLRSRLLVPSSGRTWRPPTAALAGTAGARAPARALSAALLSARKRTTATSAVWAAASTTGPLRSRRSGSGSSRSADTLCTSRCTSPSGTAGASAAQAPFAGEAGWLGRSRLRLALPAAQACLSMAPPRQ